MCEVMLFRFGINETVLIVAYVLHAFLSFITISPDASGTALKLLD